MQGIIQFFVLFAGPIGFVLLTGYVVMRWFGISIRRPKRAPGDPPDLRVVQGGREGENGETP